MNRIVRWSLPILIFIFSCRNEQYAISDNLGTPVQIDSLPGSCPFLTKDHRGNLVMSWARSTEGGNAVFCYAISVDEGKSFGETIVVPGSDNLQPHSENLPKIVFKPSGEIIALWGAANPHPGNKYSGLVFYAQSFDEGKSWSKVKKLVDDSTSFDQRYYDVGLLSTGEAAVIWLDNRNTPKEGSSLYIATTISGRGFQQPRMIASGCCPCCRTDLFVDRNCNIHILYRGIIKDSIRDMVHSVSTDGGITFSTPGLISNDNWVINGCPHTGPAMTENSEGLHFAWFTGGRNAGCFYTRSITNGSSFDSSDRISASGSHPQICPSPGGGVVVVWDEPVGVNGSYFKRIKVQHRTASGSIKAEAFITGDTLTATYPVIAPLEGDATLVSYTIKKEEKNYIMFQRVRFCKRAGGETHFRTIQYTNGKIYNRRAGGAGGQVGQQSVHSRKCGHAGTSD